VMRGVERNNHQKWEQVRVEKTRYRCLSRSINPVSGQGPMTGFCCVVDVLCWPEGKRPLERPRRRWEDVFRMDGILAGGVYNGSSWLSIGAYGVSCKYGD
jgi:hypothetical protein